MVCAVGSVALIAIGVVLGWATLIGILIVSEFNARKKLDPLRPIYK